MDPVTSFERVSNWIWWTTFGFRMLTCFLPVDFKLLGRPCCLSKYAGVMVGHDQLDDRVATCWATVWRGLSERGGSFKRWRPMLAFLICDELLPMANRTSVALVLLCMTIGENTHFKVQLAGKYSQTSRRRRCMSRFTLVVGNTGTSTRMLLVCTFHRATHGNAAVWPSR